MTVQHLKYALYISHNVLPHTDSSANFLSSLKALNFTVSLSKTIIEISCSSVSLLEINLSSRDVMLLLSSRSFRKFVGKTEGILFSGDIEQATWYSTGSCLHSTGHSNVTLARTITNHNQNTTTGVANTSDTNTTVSLDGMASCCNLQREREKLILNVTVFVLRTCGMTVQRYYVGFQ